MTCKYHNIEQYPEYCVLEERIFLNTEPSKSEVSSINYTHNFEREFFKPFNRFQYSSDIYILTKDETILPKSYTSVRRQQTAAWTNNKKEQDFLFLYNKNNTFDIYDLKKSEIILENVNREAFTPYSLNSLYAKCSQPWSAKPDTQLCKLYRLFIIGNHYFLTLGSKVIKKAPAEIKYCDVGKEFYYLKDNKRIYL